MTARILHKGFTLIELLIVIAVLGVLAAVVLVAVNPIEQLARGRDSGRKTTVGQLGKAVQAYYTSRSAATNFVPPNAGGVGATSWLGTLQTAGEIKTVPAAVAYSITTTQCTTNVGNGYCYNSNAANGDFIVYTALESGSEKSKCTTGRPLFIYQATSTTTRSGVICLAGDPTVTDASALQ